jgi:hypothetical protein
MPEIQRAILLPPPSQFSQRTSARAVQAESDSLIDTARGSRREATGPGHAFLTLVDTRREDTVELKGKQFRFRPYTNRGAADGGARETDPSRQAGEAEALSAAAEEDVSVDILDGFGAGARDRNSSAFIASFIAQERLRQGLHNPQFEAASNAYRRAGGSPSAVDNRPRLVSVAV